MRCKPPGNAPGKIVTEVVPVGPFWEAEPEHQDYLERLPNGYTCHYIRRVENCVGAPSTSLGVRIDWIISNS